MRTASTLLMRTASTFADAHSLNFADAHSLNFADAHSLNFAEPAPAHLRHQHQAQALPGPLPMALQDRSCCTHRQSHQQVTAIFSKKNKENQLGLRTQVGQRKGQRASHVG